MLCKRIDPEELTVLLTDTLCQGLGYVLIQLGTMPEEAKEEVIINGITKYTNKKIQKGAFSCLDQASSLRLRSTMQ